MKKKKWLMMAALLTAITVLTLSVTALAAGKKPEDTAQTVTQEELQQHGGMPVNGGPSDGYKTAIEALEDEDQKAELLELLENYENAMDAKFRARGTEDQTQADEAADAAREALETALKAAGIDVSQRPEQNGQMPQMNNGEMPQLPGSMQAPQDGEMPQMPQDGAQMPENSEGTMPQAPDGTQMPGQDQEETQVSGQEADEEEIGWVRQTLNKLVNWFNRFFAKED